MFNGSDLLNLNKIKSFILDILFPVSCLSCHKYGQWICAECFSKIEMLSEQVCPYCENVITLSGSACPQCKSDFLSKNKIIPLDGLLVSTKYNRNNLSRLVHFYKYNFIFDLHAPLAQLIINAFVKNNFPLPDIIIPVPLHPKRLRWRGFNQSELLAKYIGENLTLGFSIPIISDFLIRKKYTAPQMKIKNYQERKKNIQEAFEINNNFYSPAAIVETPQWGASAKKNIIPFNIQDKTVLLIDDISTTGSTLLECARILKSAGAKKVFAAVIARQEIK